MEITSQSLRLVGNDPRKSLELSVNEGKGCNQHDAVGRERESGPSLRHRVHNLVLQGPRSGNHFIRELVYEISLCPSDPDVDVLEVLRNSQTT